jgi:hypothetical protein
MSGETTGGEIQANTWRRKQKRIGEKAPIRNFAPLFLLVEVS